MSRDAALPPRHHSQRPNGASAYPYGVYNVPGEQSQLGHTHDVITRADWGQSGGAHAMKARITGAMVSAGLVTVVLVACSSPQPRDEAGAATGSDRHRQRQPLPRSSAGTPPRWLIVSATGSAADTPRSPRRSTLMRDRAAPWWVGVRRSGAQNRKHRLRSGQPNQQTSQYGLGSRDDRITV